MLLVLMLASIVKTRLKLSGAFGASQVHKINIFFDVVVPLGLKFIPERDYIDAL